MSLEGKSVEDIQALAELADSLASNPNTRNGFLKLTKTVNPTANIPEIDIPNMLASQFAEPLKQLDALTKRNQELEMERRVEAQRRELIKAGIAPADVERVEKIMVEKKIADHATAAEYMKMSDRAAPPTPGAGLPGVRKYEQPTLPDLKTFGGDQKAYAYSTAYGVIDELRGRRAAT